MGLQEKLDRWKLKIRRLQITEKEPGRQGEWHINSKLVPRKKVKKEVLRCSLPSLQIIWIPGMHLANALQFLELPNIWLVKGCSSNPPDGVEIRTPPQEHNFFAQYLHIPWFEFETLVEPQRMYSSFWCSLEPLSQSIVNRLCALASGHYTIPSIVNKQSAQRSYSLLTWALSPRMTIATG